MKVLFTIWAKVVGCSTYIYRSICAPAAAKLMKKIIQKYLYSQIYLYLCGMKTKRIKRMNKELVTMLAIIATGATLCGLMIESTTFAAIGIAMYLLPIYVGICGNKYF